MLLGENLLSRHQINIFLTVSWLTESQKISVSSINELEGESIKMAPISFVNPKQAVVGL